MGSPYSTADGRHHALRLVIFPERMLRRFLREGGANQFLQLLRVNLPYAFLPRLPALLRFRGFLFLGVE